MELLGHMGLLSVVFGGTSLLFSTRGSSISHVGAGGVGEAAASGVGALPPGSPEKGRQAPVAGESQRAFGQPCLRVSLGPAPARFQGGHGSQTRHCHWHPALPSRRALPCPGCLGSIGDMEGSWISVWHHFPHPRTLTLSPGVTPGGSRIPGAPKCPAVSVTVSPPSLR